MMTSEAWAIVAATFLGPVLAVALTLWRGGVSELRNRRLNVFRTLMATRRVGISPDHVGALNLVEVDFYKCSGVEKSWRDYKSHLHANISEDGAWYEAKEKLLATLLFEISSVLGFNIPAMEIFKGGYAPVGWQHREARQNGALEFVHELSQGTKVLPLWLHGVTPPPQQSSPPPRPEGGG